MEGRRWGSSQAALLESIRSIGKGTQEGRKREEQHGTRDRSPMSHGRGLIWNCLNHSHPLARIGLGEAQLWEKKGHRGREGPVRKAGIPQV